MGKKPISFEITVSSGQGGGVQAFYIHFSKNKVHYTDELKANTLMADYDRQGDIVGIEVIAPVKVGDITRSVKEEIRIPLRKFLRQGAPKELVAV